MVKKEILYDIIFFNIKKLVLDAREEEVRKQ
jgi:hypothetical protein